MAEILGGEKRGWENIFCTRPLQIAISFYEVGFLCVFLLNFRMFRIGSGRYAGRPTGAGYILGGGGLARAASRTTGGPRATPTGRPPACSLSA
jgi:hypothetical protein